MVVGEVLDLVGDRVRDAPYVAHLVIGVAFVVVVQFE